MESFAGDRGVYSFGPYRLDLSRRILFCHNAKVELRPRVFDTLLYLVQNAGRLVERGDILRDVWNGRMVEEGNINQTVYVLRKMFRSSGSVDDFIITAPTRGYRFAALVRLELNSAANQPIELLEVTPESGRRASPLN